MAFTFSQPNYLWWLFVIPAVIFFHFAMLRSHKARALQFANFEAIARVKGIDLYSKNIITFGLTLCIIALSVLALSGLHYEHEGQVSKFSFVIALDVSKSMEANDIAPSRIAAARQTATDFVNSLPDGTSVGLLTFSGNAYILQEVTSQLPLVLNALSTVDISNIGGTDFNEALITSTNLLEKEPNKAIIFLSDGESNVGNLEDAMNYAVLHHVIVYTVGIGTTSGGETSYGFSKLDEDTMRAIAYNTHGQFFRAESEGDLIKAFQAIDTLKTGQVSDDLTPYLILAALILVIVEYVLSTTKFSVFP